MNASVQGRGDGTPGTDEIAEEDAYSDIRRDLQALADARSAVFERLAAMSDDEVQALRHTIREDLLDAEAEVRVLDKAIRLKLKREANSNAGQESGPDA